MKPRYLSALAVALVALSGAARAWSTGQAQDTLPIVIGYDLDSTSFLYPIAYGPTVSPSTVPRPQAADGWFETSQSQSGATVERRIKTTSFSASVVPCVTNAAALLPLSTNDIIQVNDVFNRPVYAGVFQWTSNNALTLDRSLDLTQTGCGKYKYRKLGTPGSALYDGWFSVAGYGQTTIQVDIAQMVVTGGIDFQIECMATHALTATKVLASSNIASASSFSVAITAPWDMCRVGMKVTTSDSDATPATDNEKISVYAIRRAF